MKKSMKQSTLMTFINGASIFLAAATAAFMAINFSLALQSNVENKNRFDLTLNANRFMNGSAYLTNEVRAYAATGNEVNYNNYWNEVNNLKNRDIGVENMKKIGITPDEQRMIDEMASLSNNLIPLESKAMDMTKEGNKEEAVESVYGTYYQTTIGKINSIKSDFLRVLDERVLNKVDNLHKTIILFNGISLALIIILVGLQAFGIFIVKKKIIKPIMAIRDEMAEFAKGNLHSQFSLTPDTSEIGLLVNSIIESKTELCAYIEYISHALKETSEGNFCIDKPSIIFAGDFIEIITSINDLTRNMSNTFSQIGESAQQVYMGSDMVAGAAQSLAQGATEQASSVEQLSASITSVSSQVKTNADNSGTANKISQEVAQSINQSNEQMKLMMNAMIQIQHNSNQISKVIKAIQEIAFQTNILALNASVEAARAGEAGKGFAVVAGEVRNLSIKSSEAAKDTTELIERSVVSINEGVKIAEKTAAELQEVVEHVKSSTKLISEITQASREQSAALEQVAIGIDQISIVVQGNSSTSEESAAASQELSAQANALMQYISQFKLKGGNAAAENIPLKKSNTTHEIIIPELSLSDKY